MDRFPGVEWYCDRCNAYLNDQDGFTDRKYIWKCTECGYKNSISRANLSYYERPKYLYILDFLTGFLSCLLLYILILTITLAVLIERSWKGYAIVTFCALSYLLMNIISLMYDYYVVRIIKRNKLQNIVMYIVAVFIDLIRPFKEMFTAVGSLASLRYGVTYIKFVLSKLLFGLLYSAIPILFIYALREFGLLNLILEAIKQIR